MDDHIITRKEFIVAIIFAIMGILFSSRWVILHMDMLNPILGLLLYYVILYGSVFLLSLAGLTVFNVKIEHPLQILGTILIIFSFFIVVDWESPYVNIITQGSADNVSNIYFQAEDGATWYFWDIFFDNIMLLRILTFAITPFLLTLLGAILVSEDIRLI